MIAISPSKSNSSKQENFKHLEKQEVIILCRFQSPLLPKFTQQNSQWDQFEQFRKRIHEEKQHFKDRTLSPSKTPETFQMLEKIQINNISSSDTRLRVENQELRDQICILKQEIDNKNKQQPDLQILHQQQLRLMREKYENENKELLDRLNSFTDELEELKKVYKEKSMKLYNMVIILEQDKSELIEKNIQLIDQKQISNKKDNYSQFSEQINELKHQIVNLDQRQTRLQKEKDDLQIQYNQLLSQCSDQIYKKYNTQSTENDDSVGHHFKQRQIVSKNENSKPPLSEKINDFNRSSSSMHFEDLNNSIQRQQSTKKKPNQLEQSPQTTKESQQKKQITKNSAKKSIPVSAKKQSIQDEIIKTPNQKTKKIARSSTSQTLERVQLTTQSVKQFRPLSSAKKSVVILTTNTTNSVKKPKKDLKKISKQKSKLKSQRISVLK